MRTKKKTTTPKKQLTTKERVAKLHEEIKNLESQLGQAKETYEALVAQERAERRAEYAKHIAPNSLFVLEGGRKAILVCGVNGEYLLTDLRVIAWDEDANQAYWPTAHKGTKDVLPDVLLDTLVEHNATFAFGQPIAKAE